MLKKIENYDGYYISENGDVYCNLGKGCRSKEGLRKELYKISPRITKNGYTRVYMRNSITGKREDRYIHRLVAEYFIENQEHKKCVNHKDCNRSNNRVENLEWVTHKENNDYAMKYGSMRRDKSGKFVGCV